VFELPREAELSVIIYDLLGREVRSLAVGNFKAGILNFKWNAKKNNGAHVSSGIYIVRVKVNKNVFTRRMLLIQ
jgi:flagellar hook assembly protein FlgD